MIGKLRIKNYAIIDELEIEFGKGFNVFTGETGAGKSIIIGALSLLLGEKGDPDMIRSGADEAEVEGVFEKGDETLTIKRILSRKGKSTVLINGKKSSLRELKEKGKYLFDIHGQHEHQLLLSEDTHLDFLDAYGELFPLRERVGEKVREVKNLKERIENLKEKVRLLEEKEELYRFQVDEIEKANLTPGEDEELEREKEKLENLERIREKVSLALEEIYERDGSTLEVLGRTVKELEDVLVDEELREIKKRMEEALSI
ncbi:DNA repair protein RecN, partial [bacterium]